MNLDILIVMMQIQKAQLKEWKMQFKEQNKGKYRKIEKEFQEKYAGRDISGNEAQKVIDGISRIVERILL